MDGVKCPRERCWGHLKELGMIGNKLLVGCCSCNTAWRLEKTSHARGEPITFNKAVQMKREGKIKDRGS